MFIALISFTETKAQYACCASDGPAARLLESQNQNLLAGKVSRQQLIDEWRGRFDVADLMASLYFEPYDWMKNAYDVFKGKMSWKEVVVASAPLLSGAMVKQGRAIWSATSRTSAKENALRHFLSHHGEFPDVRDIKDYIEKANRFLNDPPSGTLTKKRANGDVLRYDPGSNTFGVMDKNGHPRTLFKPDQGIKYWEKQ